MKQFFTSCCFLCRELNLRTATIVIGTVHVIEEILTLYLAAALYRTFNKIASISIERNPDSEELEGNINWDAVEKFVQDTAGHHARVMLFELITTLVLLISSILAVAGSVLRKENFLLPFIILRILQLIGGFLYAAYVFIGDERKRGVLELMFQSFFGFALSVLILLMVAFVVAAYIYLIVVVFNFYLKLRAERLERLYVHQYTTAGVPMLHTGNLPKEEV